jgi:hypothetical protein
MFRGKATHHLMQETDEGVLVNNKSVNGAQTVQEVGFPHSRSYPLRLCLP